MIIVGLVAAVLVLGALAAWAVSRADVPGVPAPVSTQSARALPQGPVGPEAVQELRFDQAARGYRMGQVDAALTRLADELADRDAEITRLRGEHPAGRPSDDTAATQPGGLSR
ncbi:DivIVA domain-containing protein [Ornithinimicrobium cerasi]|uniref:DivIVA domain-containing protein n=1 Tax=Ornithinimicrobium cerasi TaxID=2248773 RepID=A0A285VP56_9MICO|nr:DivIVA domain-containing protein [Ornithinimicrobium cerasi]SOC55687.1 DivIVA domain-containing protein [Ornithinimicrobium cerasi]